MKKNLIFGLTVFVAGLLRPAAASPGDDVAKAAAALGSQKNYSWKTTVEFGLLHTSTVRYGKTETTGYTLLSTSLVDSNLFEAVIIGTNAAVKSPHHGWQSAVEALQEKGGGANPARAFARTAQNYKTPDLMAANLAAQAQNLKAGTNGISGDLTAQSAETLLGSSLPASTNRKVSVTFWITDGKLAKYQYHATGTVKFNWNDREMDRTATTEIMDVNTTKIEVPDEAKKKLE